MKRHKPCRCVSRQLDALLVEWVRSGFDQKWLRRKAAIEASGRYPRWYDGTMPIRPENLARYPADWALRSYFVRFVRARGRCEWCDAADGCAHPITGSRVVLTCAHVHDDRPEASGLLNLAALCQLCHNRHDMPGRAQRAKERRVIASEQRALDFHIFGSCRMDGLPLNTC